MERNMTDESLTISQFCTAEKISRSMLTKLWNDGKGPRWFSIGVHKRISYEARQEWRRAREAEAAATDGLVAA
jgi:CRISPR/Cas system endoribonuclease Cas6 (RAMP superfamily)